MTGIECMASKCKPHVAHLIRPHTIVQIPSLRCKPDLNHEERAVEAIITRAYRSSLL